MLGYIEEAGRQKVELEMTSKGTYSFDALKIVCQPMDKYDALVENCKTNLTENLEIGVNKITADVNSDKDGYLFLSLPYSKGWKAKVDGVECEILQANVAYSAIPITLGKHEIKLVYHTPFLLAGVIISLLAWGIFIFLIIYNKRKSN